MGSLQGERERGKLRAVLALSRGRCQDPPHSSWEWAAHAELPSQGGPGTSLSPAEIQVGFWLLLLGPISLPESSNFQTWVLAQLRSLIRRGLQELNCLLQSRDSIFPWT